MNKKLAALMLSVIALAGTPVAAFAESCQEGIFCDRAGNNCRAIAICCDDKGRCRVFWAQY